MCTCMLPVLQAAREGFADGAKHGLTEVVFLLDSAPGTQELS